MLFSSIVYPVIPMDVSNIKRNEARMWTNRICIKTFVVLIVYIASFVVFDVYELDAIFQNINLV